MDINFTNLDKIILVVSLIVSYIFSIKSFDLGKKLSLLDIPDNKIKNHKNKTPLIGGIIIFIFITVYFLFNFNYFYEKINFLIFLLFFFILGIIDDINNISSYKRLSLTFFFLLIYFYFFNEILIKNIYFETFNKNIALYSRFGHFFSYFFTILCISLLKNAINMIDGVDGNCILISIFFILIFNIFGLNNNFFYLLAFVLTFLLFFNLKNYFFLGNSGSYLLGAIIAYQILENNSTNSSISAEKIFLILLIPGVDMLRLFCERILKKKNPFNGDQEHLHHYIRKKITKKKIIFLLISIFITALPITIYYVLAISAWITILISVTFYLIFLNRIAKFN
jgi:UDP-GlcNAc:undecaprenyl-phosphate GlcNAc-1-phosphate transferase